MEPVSFKVYLCRPSEEKPEVRRFGIIKCLSTSFAELQRKLCDVFPDVQKKSYTIEWKDGENDDITLSSDEELKIALSEMTGEPYHLHVRVISQCDASSDGKFSFEETEKGEIHPGVVCDGCNNSVHGYRYKCMQCLDFDLCSGCERKGLHSGHNMIRIASPSSWCSNLGRRIHRMHARMQSKQTAQEEETSENKEETKVKPEEWWPFFWSHGSWKSHRGRGPFKEHSGPFGPYSHRRGFGKWMGPWCTMADSWMDSGTSDCHEEQTHSKSKTESKSADGAGTCPECHTETCAEETAGVNQDTDFLKNVGERVAAFLDPLGIDVQVDIEHDGKRQKCSVWTSGKPNEHEDRGEDQEKKKMSNEAERGEKIVPDENQDKQNRDGNKSASSMEEPSTEEKNVRLNKSGTPSDNEEWTVVDESKSMDHNISATSATTEAVENTSVTEPKTADVKQPECVPLYPAIPVVAPWPPRHPDPKIEDAVQKMMSMGFTNEGGWLTQLLDSKFGDIGKALDVLQPVKVSWKNA